MIADKLKVSITNMQSDQKIPTGIRLLLRKSCHAVLRIEEMKGIYEVNINFLDNAQMQKLNKEYRDKDYPTDVLSFPHSSGGRDNLEANPETGSLMLGDIALSVPKAYEQAEQYGHSIQREFAFLTVHAMLHLLDYDHVEGGIEAVRMREKEEAVLQLLGLPRDTSYVLSHEE